MDIGVFAGMGAALYMAYEPVKKLSILNAVWKMGSASLERLEQVLDAEDTVPQPAQPVAVTDRGERTSLLKKWGSLISRARRTANPLWRWWMST
jgi:ABC-type multidrug transport system fused ATPase/permease subunit